MISKIEKLYTSSKNFIELAKISEKYAKPVEQYFNKCLPSYQLHNFTFVRTYNNSSRSIITLRPFLALKFYQNKLHLNDAMMDLNHYHPIYFRRDTMDDNVLNKFNLLNNHTKYYEPVVLEFKFNSFKDSLCFNISNKDRKINLLSILPPLYLLSISFYKRYVPSLDRRLPIFPIKSEKNINLFDYKNLNVFNQLKDEFSLTNKEIDYAQLLTLGLNTEQLSYTLNNSKRTVEKHIISLRSKFNIDKKQDLENYLATLYISHASEFVSSQLNPYSVIKTAK
ncbi:LuxR C-terminal-related transcriptional regulator [Thiotrichales bacterium 19S3-7]|nr:LuxR C-terminal-related transcriptional regulator [Thiotrichales bacterium 19S3-7]MCF6802674.1 LuxR C-terminal-related transcriptional regulator [Thiotrichales bacterium 19S3-11]